MTHDPAETQPPPDPEHPGSGPMHVQRSPVAPGASLPDDDVPRQPHERDQSIDATAAEPDPRMVQAAKDLDDGQMDTDMRVQLAWTPSADAPPWVGRRDRRTRHASAYPPRQRADLQKTGHRPMTGEPAPPPAATTATGCLIGRSGCIPTSNTPRASR